jgi:hypothetical protein
VEPSVEATAAAEPAPSGEPVGISAEAARAAVGDIGALGRQRDGLSWV